MTKYKNVLHLSETPSEHLPAPEGSSFGGLRQRVGLAVGSKKLGYSIFTVPPEKAAFPFHLHYSNEEMIYILEGKGTLRLETDVIPVFSGTFIAFPPGPDNPHQLINTSTENLRYLVVSTMDYPEIAEYPDSNEASTGLRPWYPSFLRRNPPKHPPCLLRRSGRFGCEGRALSELRRVPLAHSSMDFRPWSFAQADKVGAYVTSASPASSRDFRALYVKDSSVPYFEGETCSEIESIKKSTR